MLNQNYELLFVYMFTMKKKKFTFEILYFIRYVVFQNLTIRLVFIKQKFIVLFIHLKR